MTPRTAIYVYCKRSTLTLSNKIQTLFDATAIRIGTEGSDPHSSIFRRITDLSGVL